MLKRRLSRVFVATKCLDISVVERNPMDCLDREFRAVGHELSNRCMPKIAGLALGGVHISALGSGLLPRAAQFFIFNLLGAGDGARKTIRGDINRPWSQARVSDSAHVGNGVLPRGLSPRRPARMVRLP